MVRNVEKHKEMTMPRFQLFGFLCACICTGHTALADQYALLIGVDDYANLTPLRFCGSDVADLYKTLQERGFGRNDITVLHDSQERSRNRPSGAMIRQNLEALLPLADEDDFVLVGFSGHGCNINGKSYLCPIDARPDDAGTLISVDWVFAQLDRCRAGRKLFLVDACRNEVVPMGRRTTDPVDQKALMNSLLAPPKGVVVLASCDSGQFSHESPKLSNGAFMHFVASGLQGAADSDRDQQVSLFELFEFVNDHTKKFVFTEYRAAQTPTLKGEISGNFSIATLQSPQMQVQGNVVPPVDVTDPRPKSKVVILETPNVVIGKTKTASPLAGQWDLVRITPDIPIPGLKLASDSFASLEFVGDPEVPPVGTMFFKDGPKVIEAFRYSRTNSFFSIHYGWSESKERHQHNVKGYLLIKNDTLELTLARPGDPSPHYSNDFQRKNHVVITCKRSGPTMGNEASTSP